jgi:hypothetical protein
VHTPLRFIVALTLVPGCVGSVDDAPSDPGTPPSDGTLPSDGTPPSDGALHSDVATTYTVLPLGDSNTYGCPGDPLVGEYDGYRFPLDWDTSQKGVHVLYVGSQHDTRNPLITNNAHEGWSGWTCADLLNGRGGNYPMDTISATQPDVVMLMCGTNDFNAGALYGLPYAESLADYDLWQLLNEIERRSPSSWIVLSTVFPITYEVGTPTYAFDNPSMININNWIKSEVAWRSQHGYRISLADGYSALTPAVMDANYDVVYGYSEHANASGYWLVGSKFADEIVRLSALGVLTHH